MKETPPYLKEKNRMEFIKRAMAYHLEGRKVERVIYVMEIKK